MNGLLEEAEGLCDDCDAIGESLENDGDDRGAVIKAKIARLRAILIEMAG